MKKITFYLLVAPLLLVGASAHAQAVLKTGVVGAGGGSSASSEYRLQGTVGSFAPRILAGNVHVVRGGFWPQVRPAAGPVAVPMTQQDDVVTDEDVPLAIRPLDNDTDPAGGTLAITSFTQPANGAVEETAEGELTYSPTENFFGQDSFTYTATNEAGGSAAGTVVVAVAPVNDPPTFASEPVTGAAASEDYTYNVQATDVDGDELALSASTLPSWLTFTDGGNGTGTLEGTPTNAEAGDHEVLLEAADTDTTVSQAFVVTVVLGVPAVPALSAPADGSTDVERNVTLDWTDVAGASSYNLQLSTEETFSTPMLDSTGITGSALETVDLAPSTRYYWRVRAVNDAGASAFTGPFSFTTVSNVAAEDVSLPREYRLHQNYPNPFNPSTRIAFDLPASADVRLVVYDLFGRAVTTVVDARFTAGSHEVPLALGSLASGGYFYRIEAGEFRAVRRMILLK